jgi:hypothetical protein
MTPTELAIKLREILRIVSENNSIPLSKERATWLKQLDDEIRTTCAVQSISPPNFTPLASDGINSIGFCRIPCDHFQPVKMSRPNATGNSTKADEKRVDKRVLVVRELPRWVEAMNLMIEGLPK